MPLSRLSRPGAAAGSQPHSRTEAPSASVICGLGPSRVQRLLPNEKIRAVSPGAVARYCCSLRTNGRKEAGAGQRPKGEPLLFPPPPPENDPRLPRTRSSLAPALPFDPKLVEPRDPQPPLSPALACPPPPLRDCRLSEREVGVEAEVRQARRGPGADRGCGGAAWPAEHVHWVCWLPEEGGTNLLTPRLEEEEHPLWRGRELAASEALNCPDNETHAPSCSLGALYWACARNDPAQLQSLLDGGVSPEEATQVDSNGRTGLMVACYHGFGSIVALLNHCPFLDVNQQDREGDTALMLAAQAGHVPLVSLLLNYYAGLDLERRDQRGLTALMKAAMRDRSECADLEAVDPARGKTALEWAVLTDSFTTVQRIRQLLRRPRAEQLSQHYQPEWPALSGLVAQAQTTPSLLERLQATLSLPFSQSPQEGGVLDHLVTVTTSLASPFLTTACCTLCPDRPPALGTRNVSVPELLGTVPVPPLTPKSSPVVPNASVLLIPYQSPQGMLSLCPHWLQPRDSTSPKPQAPRILLSKAPKSPRQHKQEPKPAERSLALPIWRYQELRRERRKQEEEARCAQSLGKMG
ncbi:LOW QUALITY PROTEIN: photoreceptor ankyrin repeat protein [Orycteropus afer afer]|uniref:LOW QUALITY PROTEIN: photoreceptor ankyrin repeat protein n=1 Tax=Orycteropus afer afer TaxID=1230840 RepID=A0A8B7AJY4_ORYAF|nr:LOW QUALITY PROTEIN: photoreceptor ankyrin repeat protein [Orycteropus afer afer]